MREMIACCCMLSAGALFSPRASSLAGTDAVAASIASTASTSLVLFWKLTHNEHRSIGSGVAATVTSTAAHILLPMLVCSTTPGAQAVPQVHLESTNTTRRRTQGSSCPAGKYPPLQGSWQECHTYGGCTEKFSNLDCCIDNGKCAAAGCGGGISRNCCCQTCPAGTTSPAGSTSLSQCTPKPGYYGRPGHVAARCTARHCDSDRYRTGCGGTHDYSCAYCPAGTQSKAGTTSLSRCTVAAGFYGVAGKAATPCPSGAESPTGSTKFLQCTQSCPAGTARGIVQSLSQCQALTNNYNTGDAVLRCPVGTQSVAGATSLSQCTVAAGFYGVAGKATACPLHSSGPAGATTAAQCSCATGFFDRDASVVGVTCTKCKASCGANEFQSAECLAVSATQGQDAACAPCPAHSKLKLKSQSKSRGDKRRRAFGISGVSPPLLQDCVCDPGFFDEALALAKVACVAIPPHFGAGSTTTCQVQRFSEGREQGVALNMSVGAAVQYGVMLNYVANITADVLREVDYDGVCGNLLQTYAGPGTICNKQFALFAKTGNSATHVTFLGKMTLNCQGKGDAYVLGKVCLEPCISDPTTRCCWVPAFMAQLFPCCGPYGCCPPTEAPTPSPQTCAHGMLKIVSIVPGELSVCAPCADYVAKEEDCKNGEFEAQSCLANCFANQPPAAGVSDCKDQHARCPLLKQQLDAGVNGSCFTSDFGELTGVPAYSGVHLNDQCCASCQPGCAKCLDDGHAPSLCTQIQACVGSSCAHPTLPANCVACMGASSSKAQCESYGVSCTEDCADVAAASPTAHRRAQAGAAAAVQVQHSHSIRTMAAHYGAQWPEIRAWCTQPIVYYLSAACTNTRSCITQHQDLYGR